MSKSTLAGIGQVLKTGGSGLKSQAKTDERSVVAEQLTMGERFMKLSQTCANIEAFRKEFEKLKTKNPASSKKPRVDREAKSIRVFGVDCEMVITNDVDGNNSEYTLARASLVELAADGSFRLVFDVFVQIPEGRLVHDRLEYVSGVSESDLANAKHSLEDVIGLLNSHVTENDVIVGHSLSSDFEALRWWHSNVVDTSFFYTVRNAPRITLGLKDVVSHSLGETVHATGAGAHDPVVDAKFALSVARVLATKPDGPFVEMNDVPSRFKRLISLHNFDISLWATPHEMLLQLAQKYGAVISKPLKTSNRDGVKSSSVTFEFPTAESAIAAFALVPANETLNSKHGYLDQAGFLKKFVSIQIDDSGAILQAEMSSYHRPEITVQKEFKCPRNKVGRLLGRKGARVIHISRMSGAQISKDSEEKDHTRFNVRGDSEDKVASAVELMKRAADGDELGVQ